MTRLCGSKVFNIKNLVTIWGTKDAVNGGVVAELLLTFMTN